MPNTSNSNDRDPNVKSPADHDAALSSLRGPTIPGSHGIPSNVMVRVSDHIQDLGDKGLRVGESHFRHFRAAEVQFGGFRTMQYAPTEQRIKVSDSPVVLASFHGLNATISHAGSGLAFINDLVSNHGIYAETIDQPGCGNNEDFSTFDSLDSALDFYTSYLLELKDRAGARPLVTTGFCYSAGFLVEINKRTPGLIDGMAHSGLIIPDRKIGLDYSIAVESKMYEDALIRENPAVRVRADRIYAELGWTHDRNPFGNVQTLILKGQNDPFMTPAACQLFQKWASQFPETVNYMEIEGGGHGVFRPIANFPQSTATVRQAVLALIDRVVTSK